ncbi:MAG: cation:proton antiporter [Cyanobacteria bacterium REEB67]|nr:cation:proton antiporter [Cyanobacteria bacterium REEB67]
MNEFALIRDLGLMWTSAMLAGFLCLRARQPVIASYMVAGMLIGPYGLKPIGLPGQIRVLSEFGVTILLFALGVDLSLKQIVSSARRLVVRPALSTGPDWASPPPKQCC